jgi:hypothetical protein
MDALECRRADRSRSGGSAGHDGVVRGPNLSRPELFQRDVTEQGLEVAG